MMRCIIALISFIFMFNGYSFASLSVYPNYIKQGNTFVVTSDVPKKKGFIFNKTVNFYPKDAKYIAIVGVDIRQAPGGYTFTADGISDEAKIEVIKVIFPTSYVKVERKKMKLLGNDYIEKDINKFNTVITCESQSQLWTGKFAKPLSTFKYISTLFGFHRRYNKTDFGYHRGIDYAASSGSPVLASNTGVVVLSELLDVHGNTIVIDHGQGIYTLYCHLSKRYYSKGDHVNKGEMIGRVGSTGLSSGPHLHFGLSVHDVRVNPAQWLSRDIINI